ncbi:MAG: ChaB family protein [Anaerolineae bacterium]|nr:ChaB family protein [Anaerolineae bacterium]
MPYQSLLELPTNVRYILPVHAQDIYTQAFNRAWEQYQDAEDRRGNDTREATAHKVAWAAVKQSYAKDEQSGKWRKK